MDLTTHSVIHALVDSQPWTTARCKCFEMGRSRSNPHHLFHQWCVFFLWEKRIGGPGQEGDGNHRISSKGLCVIVRGSSTTPLY